MFLIAINRDPEVVWVFWTGSVVNLLVGALPLRGGSHP
jgi:hypothetical protein